MKDISYVLQNFFTHKDFLVPPEQIPGTLFTPLHFLFEGLLLIFLVGYALWLSRHKEKIPAVLKTIWLSLLCWEFVTIWWDSTQGLHPGLDLREGLSLYPCSLFLYALPLVIWGKGAWKQIGFGYIFTLGLLGAGINFLYPYTRLQYYSCLSFPAFHTFAFHGSMLFVFLVLLFSGEHSYSHVTKLRQLFYPCVLSLLQSLPANLLNYTIGADYMYFRGKVFLMKPLVGSAPDTVITGILYVLYIAVPALFYLPSYIHGKLLKQPADPELVDLFAGEKLRFLPFR